MQCRLNCVTINETQKILTNDPTPQTCDIMINIKYSDADNYNLILPLSLKGVTSYLLVHNPTKE